jgi:hypothetical protein
VPLFTGGVDECAFVQHRMLKTDYTLITMTTMSKIKWLFQLALCKIVFALVEACFFWASRPEFTRCPQENAI